MSRINNSQPKVQQTQQKAKPSQAQTNKAGENAFANRLNHKGGPQKKSIRKDAKGNNTQSLQDAKDGKEGKLLNAQGSKEMAMLQRQGYSVLGRRGKGGKGMNVADLQAQLQGKGNASKGEKGAALEGQGLGELGDKAKDAVLKNLDPGEMKETTSDTATFNPNAQSIGGEGAQPLGVGTEIQVKGTKLSPEMLDKIVDQARLGVNAKGNAEFQFDLKGDVLGGMKMRMTMEDGQLKAIFVAENPEVRKLVDGNLQDLRRALEDRGIHIRDLEVRDPEEDRRQRQRDQNNKDREQQNQQG